MRTTGCYSHFKRSSSSWQLCTLYLNRRHTHWLPSDATSTIMQRTPFTLFSQRFSISADGPANAYQHTAMYSAYFFTFGGKKGKCVMHHNSSGAVCGTQARLASGPECPLDGVPCILPTKCTLFILPFYVSPPASVHPPANIKGFILPDYQRMHSLFVLLPTSSTIISV